MLVDSTGNPMKNRFVLSAALPLALVISAASAQRPPMPPETYLCHVSTENMVGGVTFVQADSTDEARRAALGAAAWESPESTAPTVAVTECVAYPGERLASREMQKLAETLPR
jgi:hypothetical protein